MSFENHQAAFAAYIRNPEKNPLPDGAKPERMAMYRELFFNNINGFLTANFPVLHSILSSENWTNLAQDFFELHVCQTPHFSEIPEEFLAYLQNERHNETDLPFLFELAHYEWVEMALSIANAPMERTIENSEQSPLKLSSLASVLGYQFPVQKICSQFVPRVAPDLPTFLVVYRNADDAMQFLEITPLTFRLLQLIEANSGHTAEAYLIQLTESVPMIKPQFLKEKGREILTDFAQRGILCVDHR